MALDAATLALVANELNSTLLDAKIDKIFEPTRDEVLMTLRTRTQTFKLLLSARSGSARVCLTKESFENPLTPPGFCMLLRKHLTGGRLTGKQAQLGIHQAGEYIVAQPEHAIVGDARQRVLRSKLRNTAQNEHEQHSRRHHPQRQRAFSKTAIQQGLEHGRYGSFRQCSHQGG